MIAGTERSKRHLIVPRIFAECLCLPAYSISMLFTERSVNKSRLTEAAAPYTTSENFNRYSVLYYFGKRNNKIIRIIDLVKIPYYTLVNDFGDAVGSLDTLYPSVRIIDEIIEFRDINTINISGATKKIISRSSLLFHIVVKIHQFKIDLFSFAKYKNIKKISQRLGIAHARTTCNDDLCKLTGPFSRINRYARKIKHIEHICI